MTNLPNREKADEQAMEFIRGLESLLAVDSDVIEISPKLSWGKTYHALKSNLKKIVEYAKYKMVNDGVKPYSMSRFVNYIMFFADFIGKKPFEDARREDIEAYLNKRKGKGDSERYMFMLKISLRSFFKWMYKYETGYPDVVKWMNCKLPRTKDVPKRIELEEIQKLLETN